MTERLCVGLFVLLCAVCAVNAAAHSYNDVRSMPDGWIVPLLPEELTEPLVANAHNSVFDELYSHMESRDPDEPAYEELLADDVYFYDHVVQRAFTGRFAAVSALHAIIDSKASSCEAYWCSTRDYHMAMMNFSRIEVARLTEYYVPTKANDPERRVIEVYMAFLDPRGTHIKQLERMSRIAAEPHYKPLMPTEWLTKPKPLVTNLIKELEHACAVNIAASYTERAYYNNYEVWKNRYQFVQLEELSCVNNWRAIMAPTENDDCLENPLQHQCYPTWEMMIQPLCTVNTKYPVCQPGENNEECLDGAYTICGENADDQEVWDFAADALFDRGQPDPLSKLVDSDKADYETLYEDFSRALKKVQTAYRFHNERFKKICTEKPSPGSMCEELIAEYVKNEETVRQRIESLRKRRESQQRDSELKSLCSLHPSHPRCFTGTHFPGSSQPADAKALRVSHPT
jgi:hypothetical protein